MDAVTSLTDVVECFVMCYIGLLWLLCCGVWRVSLTWLLWYDNSYDIFSHHGRVWFDNMRDLNSMYVHDVDTKYIFTLMHCI
jgi:hypothetical protein